MFCIAKHHKNEMPRRIDGQSGSALAFVLIISVALLFVAAMGLSIGLSHRRSSVSNLHAKAAFFCAESAMERARQIVASNSATWNSVLSGGTEAWHPITGNCSGSGNMTYEVRIRDNADEQSGTDNPQVDIDHTVIVDAIAFINSLPVAQVNGIISSEVSEMMSDYATQDRQGSQKLGNQ